MQTADHRCRSSLRSIVITTWCAAAIWGLSLGTARSPAQAAELWIGAATADITPDQPVPLTGGSSVRIARDVLNRCTANVLALESRDGQRTLDQAILVSCDLCVIRPGIQEGFRKHLAGRLPGFDLNKLFLAATHTHAAPVILQDRFDEKDYGDAMQPKEYVPWMYEQMAQAVVKAWEGRSAGAVAWGLGHAVAGHNRRIVYSDGSAKMHGNTNDPKFRGIEGYEDHAVHILCFYDSDKRLKATAITMATTAQCMGGTKVSADLWHDVRRLIHERHGGDVCVLGFCAPAGDQTPRAQVHKKAEQRMYQLRGLTYTQEIARRIANTFDDVAGVIAQDIRTDVPLVHRVQQIELPARSVTDAEYAVAKTVCERIDAKKKLTKSDYWSQYLYGFVAERYLAQQQGGWKTFEMELHVLRLGDVAIATNPFELFLDYGILSVAVVLTTFFGIVVADDEAVVDIGSRRELFVDHFLIEKLDGVWLKLHEPRPTPLVPDTPSGHYATVLKDGDLYRRYDRGGMADHDGDARETTRYWASRDGIHWTKPNLGLYELNGSRDNNVIQANTRWFAHNFSPFLDRRPEVEKDQRFKALAGVHKGGGLCAFVSGDGIRWRKLKEEPVITSKGFAFDSQNVSF